VCSAPAPRDLVGNEVVSIDRFITLVDAPAAAPEDDSFEDNDTWDQATPLTCGDSIDAIAVGGDDDWYRLTVPAGQGRARRDRRGHRR
jgi:hypothetical protein